MMGTPWRGRIFAFSIAALLALGVGFFSPSWLRGGVRAVAIYDAAIVGMIFAFWTFGMHKLPEQTRVRSAIADPGRNAVLAFVLASIIVGLSSAVMILGQGPKVTSPNEKWVIYGVGLIAVAAGWILIHSIFVFRYAHLYYFDSDDDGSAQRGIVFPGDQEPNDFDFAYFSFVIGMTFQVSDVVIKDRGVRSVVLFHGLISFAYNTAIVALVINLLSGLFH